MWRSVPRLFRSAPVSLLSKRAVLQSLPVATGRVASGLDAVSRRDQSSLAQKAAPDSPDARPAASSFPDSPTTSLSPHTPSQSEGPAFDTIRDVLSQNTLRAVRDMKITNMSPVQAEVLSLLPEISELYDENAAVNGEKRPPRDLLVRAKTGTGKTLAFLIPAIESRLKQLAEARKGSDASLLQAVKDSGLPHRRSFEKNAKRGGPLRDQVGTLIISPTRELATQIANEALKLTKFIPDLQVQLFTGGTSKRAQMRDWDRGRRDIVVATPGRLRDVLGEEDVAKAFSHTKMLILDEADTLLDMGFREEIEAINEYLPQSPARQTFLFSATVSRAIQQIARQTLDKNHKFINCVADNAPAVHAHVDQYHTVLPSAADQIPHTLRLLAHDQLANPGRSKCIVFFPTTKMTQLFADLMRDLSRTSLPAKHRTRVYELHSKKSQEQRNRASDAFREDKSGSSVLITSDVSARGVDYPNVTRVIQVGIPAGTEQYIHRVGRTGRAGTSGRGDLVLMPWELGFVNSSLAEVPLKPLSVKELEAQTAELAARFDEDPKAFWKDVPITIGAPQPPQTGYRDRGRRPVSSTPSQPPPFQTPLRPLIEDIARSVQETISALSEETVEDVMFSLLGYYPSQAEALKLSRPAVLEGCKRWTTEACGLSEPPRIPNSLLQRLGLVDNGRGRPRGGSGFGGRGGGGGGGDRRTSSRGGFAERGNRERGSKEWRDYQERRPASSGDWLKSNSRRGDPYGNRDHVDRERDSGRRSFGSSERERGGRSSSSGGFPDRDRGRNGGSAPRPKLFDWMKDGEA